TGERTIVRNNARWGSALSSDRRRQAEKLRQPATMQMVITCTEAEDVVLVRLASVVLYLMVRLHGRLGCKKVWAGTEVIGTRSQTKRILSNGQFNSGSRIEDA